MRNRVTFLILFLTFLSASTTWATPSGEITVWCMGEEGNHIRNLAREFEESHPGTKIITQGIPWDGAHDRLITAVAGNITPDVTQLGTTWVSEFAAMGALQDLEEKLNNSPNIHSGDFFKSSLDTGRWHKNLYALPWYVDVRVVFYRSDILSEAGWNHYPLNWDEFEQMAEKVTKDMDGDGKIDQYAINFSYRDEQHLIPFIWQAGGDIMDQDENLVIDSPETQTGLEIYKSLFANGFNPGASNSQVDPFVAFSEGYYVSWMSGPWMVGECQRRLPPEMEGKWMVAMLPGIKYQTSFLGGCDLAIFKQSKNPELAWAFVEYLCSPEVQLKWNSITGNLPAVIQTWEYPQLANDPIWSVFRNQLNDAKAVPPVECYEAMAEAIKNEGENLVIGKATSAETAKNLKKRIGLILSQRRSSPGNVQRLAPVLTILFSITLILIFSGLIFSQRGYFKTWPKWKTPTFFLIPILLHLSIFIFIPILVSLFLSFTDYDIYSIGDWTKTSLVGFRNYFQLLGDPLFWQALLNTGYFIAVAGPLTILLALSAALLLDHPKLPFRSFFRTGFFLPVVIPLVAIAVVWRWIYSPQHGLLNWFVEFLGFSKQDWLADPHLAMPCLIAMAVWKNFGYSMVIFLAGLQAIPKTVKEAASIDGANSFNTLRFITIPMLRPTLVLVMILTTIGYMQFFAEPYIMTNLGGPQNKTLSVVLYLYKEGFKFFHLGFASAMAYTLCAIIAILSSFQIWFMKRSEGDA